MTPMTLGLGLLGMIAAFVTFTFAKHIPGIKCITWCRIKQIKYDRAKKKITKMIVIDHNNWQSTFKEMNFEGYTTGQLSKLYEASEPFGCRSFRDDGNIFEHARKMLKDRIAEGHLLELE